MQTVVESEELQRRLRAALALSGLKSVDELAKRIGIEGLGRDVLYDMQRGKRAVRRHELREIAEACSVPLAFFEAENFDALDRATLEIAEHDARIDEMARAYDEQRAEQHSEVMDGINAIRGDLGAVANALADLTQQIAEQAAQRFADERSARSGDAGRGSDRAPTREVTSQS